jgi:hypothetical protein
MRRKRRESPRRRAEKPALPVAPSGQRHTAWSTVFSSASTRQLGFCAPLLAGTAGQWARSMVRRRLLGYNTPTRLLHTTRPLLAGALYSPIAPLLPPRTADRVHTPSPPPHSSFSRSRWPKDSPATANGFSRCSLHDWEARLLYEANIQRRPIFAYRLHGGLASPASTSLRNRWATPRLKRRSRSPSP